MAGLINHFSNTFCLFGTKKRREYFADLALQYITEAEEIICEETIDSQHKRLLDYINKLIKQLSRSSGADLRLIRETIDFLGKYAQEHFSYEERYKENKA